MASQINSISYSPDLITSLMEEHQKIAILLQQIEQSLKSQDYNLTSQLFSEFKFIAYSHTAKENLKLYVYLHNHTKQFPEIYSKLRQWRKYVDSIEARIVDFFDKFGDFESNLEKQASILGEFKQFSSSLSQKNNIEEKTIFPIYWEPHLYDIQRINNLENNTETALATS